MTPKLVIIDDERPIQQMYRAKLENAGFQVATASNGVEGLRLIQKLKPDLVLLDLRMPIMGGDELLQRLRSSEWGADTRVIILTNISRSEAPSALRFLHVDAYVVKAHSTPAQIVELVRRTLELH